MIESYYRSLIYYNNQSQSPLKPFTYTFRFTLEVPLFSEQVYSLQGFGNEEPAMTITSEAQPQVSCPGSTRSDLQNLKTIDLKTTRRFYWEEGQLFMNLQTR